MYIITKNVMVEVTKAERKDLSEETRKRYNDQQGPEDESILD